MFKKKRHEITDSSETANPWSSYSDMMAALLLVFVLIMFHVVYQYLDTQEANNAIFEQLIAETELQHSQLLEQQTRFSEQESQLIQQQERMSEQEAQLADQQEQMSAQEARLAEQQEQMGQQEARLAEQQAQMGEQEARLAEQQEQMSEQEAQLAEQQARTDEQEAQLAAQSERMTEQETQLALQEERIEQIIGVKSRIIIEMKALLDEAGLVVEIDEQTGAITLDSSIFFDANSSTLKPQGKTYLDTFLPLYLQVLLDSNNSEYISEIIIEGHTDTRGGYMFNLRLSQNRALAVAEYCIDDMKTLSTEQSLALRALLTANGRSYSRPVLQEDGQVDMDASRRVEFKFRLKDFEMITDMQRILEGEPT